MHFLEVEVWHPHCDNLGQILPLRFLLNPAVTKTTRDLRGTASCDCVSRKYRLEGRCSTELNSFTETSAANQKEVLLQITELPVMNGSDSETHLSMIQEKSIW